MSRIIAGTLALSLLGSTWLFADESTAKKTNQPHPASPTAQQLQQMKAQFNQQQAQIKRLQEQLRQSNQALQQTHQQLQSSVQKANEQTQAAQQQAASAHQATQKLNTQINDVKNTLGNAEDKPAAK